MLKFKKIISLIISVNLLILLTNSDQSYKLYPMKRREIMNKQMLKQIIALLACIFIVLVSFLSVAFIIEHTEHDCTGYDCAVCTQIHTVENLLKQLALAITVLSLFYIGLRCCRMFLQIDGFTFAKLTPIKLKVRMNN